MGDVRVNHRELTRFVTAVFSATGMRASDAGTVAEVLVWANERGVDSHGVMRIPDYLKDIKKGKFNPTAQPQTRQLLPATFMMHCNRAPGSVCMMRAAALAIEVACKFGVGIGLLSNPHHLGAIGRVQPDYRADAVAVRFRPGDPQPQGAVAVEQIVPVKECRTLIRSEEEVDIAIVVKIAVGEPPCDFRSGKVAPKFRGDIAEAAAALVEEEVRILGIAGVGTHVSHGGVDMPVDDAEIQPAVEVRVEKGAAEAQAIARGGGDPGRLENHARRLLPRLGSAGC